MSDLELEFLTDDERLRELAQRYWRLEGGTFVYTLAELAEASGVLQAKIPSTVATISRAFTRTDACVDCGTPRSFSSRSDYSRLANASWESWTCTPCREDQKAESARVAEARDKRRIYVLNAELDRGRKQWQAPNNWPFTDAVFLAAVLRAGGAEDLSHVMPRDYYRGQLSPTNEFDWQVLNHLYHNRRLCIHPGSRADTIILKEDDAFSFYPMEVHWSLPLPDGNASPARVHEALDALLRDQAAWAEGWSDQADDLHRELAVQECLQYLRVVLKEHGFELNPGEKTLAVVRAALNDFSIGQVFNFMWRAAKDAAAFYVRESVSKAHAANIVPGAIQKSAERATAEAWTVRAFRRDYRAPESILSGLFFTGILRLPDSGLSTPVPRAK